jgi:hypothetical protein
MVAADTPPGLYRGNILLEPPNAERREVAFIVEVFGALLPDGPTLPFMVGLDWDSMFRYDGSSQGRAGFLRDVLPGYFATLRAAGAVPFNPFDALPALPEDPGAPVDLAPIDRRLQEALGPDLRGPVDVPFSLSWPLDPARFPLFSDDWRSQARSYLRAVARHYAERGLVNRSFIYVAEADEPTRADQVARIVELHRLVAEADPRLRVIQTVHARCFDCNHDALKALDSPVTLWVPNIAFYDDRAVGIERSWTGRAEVRRFQSGWPGEFEARVRASGREVWWYVNAATGALPPEEQPHYPGLHIDYDAMAHRVMAWMAWDRSIAALGHWMATYWRGRASPWEVVPRGERGEGTNGDGALLYPARGAELVTGQPAPSGPISSIRLETIREGGEDHKLLTVAAQRLGREATRRLAAPMQSGLDAFPLDPGPLRTARLALLRALQ